VHLGVNTRCDIGSRWEIDDQVYCRWQANEGASLGGRGRLIDHWYSWHCEVRHDDRIPRWVQITNDNAVICAIQPEKRQFPDFYYNFNNYQAARSDKIVGQRK
jgi:hypothetical protein